MAQLRVGDQAPVFTLADQDGNITSLADFVGRRVVVYFYEQDEAPGCSAEACQFDDLLDQFSALGADVVGISPDDRKSHQRFRDKYKLRFNLLSDTDHRVMGTYGVVAEKITWNGRRKVGVVRSTFIVGPNGEVLRTWYDVSPYGHADAVRAALVG